MLFYLLGFFVALTTIFGLAHSQTAREKLHLQRLYDWSFRATQILQACNSDETATDMEFFEVTVEQPEAQKLEGIRSDSIEEVLGIRFRTESPTVQKSWDSASRSHPERNEPRNRTFENSDQFLASISASLQKLSVAASSVRINGAQLYEILLKETLKHDRNMTRQQRIDECPESSDVAGSVIEDVTEEETNVIEAPQKPKMYFGESPLEYVPHQEK